MRQAFRQAADQEGGGVRPGAAPDTRRGEAENPGYYCAMCGELVTRHDARMRVQGSHTHRFSNPAGYVYDIGCFRQAPGCLSAGEPSAFYSWFDGFTWCYALCRSCGVHLGWTFLAAEAEGGFYGLILNRLVGPPERSPARH